MISILIPTYNYNITALFNALKTELTSLTIDYEIICHEDGSAKHVEENSNIIGTFTNATHIVSKVNKGRITTRQSLAEMAKYEWLLFLDADVIPQGNSFLGNYINFTAQNYDAIYGGCSYDIKQPKKPYILRWKYGKNNENIDAKTRNKTPYKVAISGNFMIKKPVFLELNSKVENDGYGYDNFIAALMKANHIKIFHIDNTAIHKGLDTNTAFLNKTEKAVATIAEIHKKYPKTVTDNSLLEFYKTIKSIGFSKLIAFLFNLSKAKLRKQLLSSNPNLTLFQFYKLGYLCTLTSNKK